MDPELKAEWLRRLRSGAYAQGTGALNRDGRFCCLGVLCEIGVDRGELVREEQEDYNYRHSVGYCLVGHEDYEPQTQALNGPLSVWAGLGSPDGYLFSHPDGETLAELNDEGMPFAEIAELIEEYL